MINILTLLDNQIEIFRQENNKYPTTIIMSKEVKDKIFKAFELEPDIDNSWFDMQDNYRGIDIIIKENTFIKLKGE